MELCIHTYTSVSMQVFAVAWAVDVSSKLKVTDDCIFKKKNFINLKKIKQTHFIVVKFLYI